MSPEIVAHRGASARLPEHTLAAYELALREGADGLECDVRLTRDGHLVCVHDRRIDRTSDGTGLVSTMTLAELQARDFGSWRGEPAGVLTLEALLGLAEDCGTRLFVEAKHPVRYGGRVERALVAALDRHRVDAVMMSFSIFAVHRFKKLRPDVPAVLLHDRLWPRTKPRFVDYEGPGVHLLRRHPDRGRGTYVWTVDDPADIALCRERGVRFLATNNPGETRERLAANLTPDQL